MKWLMPPQQPRTFYRDDLSNLLVCAMMSFTALYFLTRAIRDGSALPIGLDVLAMFAFAFPAFRYPRHGVITTSAGVVVRNIFKTHVLAWSDIERFELARHKPWPMVGVAVLTDGRRIPMTGIQNAPASRFARRTIEALNDELRSERTGDPVGASGRLVASAAARSDAAEPVESGVQGA